MCTYIFVCIDFASPWKEKVGENKNIKKKIGNRAAEYIAKLYTPKNDE